MSVLINSYVFGAAPDVTAPTLSSATGTATSDTTADLSVSTDEGNGTLYWVVTQSITGPTKAQVKLGQNHLGAAADDSGNQAVSGTGVQNITGGATGLTAETEYFAHFMHEDAATNQSDVATSASFETDAAGAGPTPSFRSQDAAATSASTTVAPAYPAGLAADDILILAVNFSGDGVTVTTPADFTQIGNTETFAEDPSTNDMMSAVYWKRADGTESGNLTVTRSGVGGGASFFGAVLLAYQDALQSGDPTEAISDVTDATSPYTMGAITTLGANRRVISVFCVDDNEARTSGPESGWANRVAFLSGTGTDGTIVVDDAEQASAGSPTNNTFGTTSDQGAGIHAFALKPNPA